MEIALLILDSSLLLFLKVSGLVSSISAFRSGVAICDPVLVYTGGVLDFEVAPSETLKLLGSDSYTFGNMVPGCSVTCSFLNKSALLCESTF